MKRILLTISILLCLCGQAWPCDGDVCKAPIQLARMNAYVIGSSGGTAAGGEMLTCAGGGKTETTATGTAGYWGFSAFTASSTQTITSIGISINNVLTATKCWIGLYGDVPSGGDYTYDRLAYGLNTSLSAGWNAVAISYEVQSGTTYYIVKQCDANVTLNVYSDATPVSQYDALVWSDTPPIGFNVINATAVCERMRATY